jgi:hypothetical protein
MSPETERAERYRAKIPTETAYPESALGFAVWKNWMVGVIGIELVTPSLFERKTTTKNVFPPW